MGKGRGFEAPNLVWIPCEAVEKVVREGGEAVVSKSAIHSAKLVRDGDMVVLVEWDNVRGESIVEIDVTSEARQACPDAFGEPAYKVLFEELRRWDRFDYEGLKHWVRLWIRYVKALGGAEEVWIEPAQPLFIKARRDAVSIHVDLVYPGIIVSMGALKMKTAEPPPKDWAYMFDYEYRIVEAKCECHHIEHGGENHEG